VVFCADVVLRRFRAVSVPSEDDDFQSARREPLARFWRWLLWRERVWAEVEEEAHFVERYAVLFDGYRPRRQWFGLVEMGVTLACGVLGGLMPVDPESNCVGLLAAMCALNSLLLVAFVALRPLEVRMEVGVASLNYLCGVLWGPLVLTDRVDAANGFAQAQLWLQVVLLGLLVLRMILNGTVQKAALRLGRATIALVRGAELPGLATMRCARPTLQHRGLRRNAARGALQQRTAATKDSRLKTTSADAQGVDALMDDPIQMYDPMAAARRCGVPSLQSGEEADRAILCASDVLAEKNPRLQQIIDELRRLPPARTPAQQRKAMRLIVSVVALSRRPRKQ
jgi:hypothetical protein